MKQLRVDIDLDMQTNFIKKVPWGYVGKLVRALLSMCKDATKIHGFNIVYDIIKGRCIIRYKEKKDE